MFGFLISVNVAEARLRNPTSFGSIAGPVVVTGTGTCFSVDSPTFVVDCDNNRVGIGTTTPLTPLQLSSSGTVTTLGQMSTNLRLENLQTSTVGAGSGISFSGRGDQATVGTYAAIDAPITGNSGTGASGYLSFSVKNTQAATSLTEAVRIINTGLVGIGTSSPGSLLSVSGSNVNTTGSSFQSTPGISIVNTNTTANNLSPFYFRQANSVGTNVTSAYIAGKHIDHTSASEDGGIEFGGTTAGTTNTWGIWQDGTLAVNLANPNNYAKFQVATTSTTGNQALVQLIVNSGTVGQRASIDWTMSTAQATQGNPLGARIWVQREAGSAISSMYMGVTANGVAYQDILTLASTTNVGIGTTTPFAKLSVTGLGATTGRILALADSNNVDKIIALDNGNLFLKGLSAAAGTPGSLCYVTTTNEVTQNNALTCTVSARDMKNSISPLVISGIDTVMKLKPSIFKYNDQDRIRYGFIADELQAVDPRLADGYGTPGHPKDEARTIDEPGILATLVKAIQEVVNSLQQVLARVTGLEQKVANQQAQIDVLQAQVKLLINK